MSKLKFAALGGIFAVALASGPAFAVNQTFDVWSANSTGLATQNDPDNWGGITVGDKRISLVDYGVVTIQGTAQNAATLTTTDAFNEAADELRVAFTEDLVNGRHQVNLLPDSGSPFSFAGMSIGDTLAVQYVINILPSSYPPDAGELRFGTVFLGLNVASAGGLTVTKRVQGLTPWQAGNTTAWSVNNNFALGQVFDQSISTDGQTNQQVFCGVCVTFLVTDYITLVGNQGSPTSLSSISNTYEQVLPVPAPLALVATGLLGIGVARRMKKA